MLFLSEKIQFPLDILVQDNQIILKEKRFLGKSFISPLSSTHLSLEAPDRDDIFGTLHIRDEASGVKSLIRLTADEIEELRSFFDGTDINRDLWFIGQSDDHSTSW